MGITYGDHLIDSGYNDITPEQERAQERGCKCYLPGDCDGSCTHPEPVKCQTCDGRGMIGALVPWGDGEVDSVCEPCPDCSTPDALPASKEAEATEQSRRERENTAFHEWWKSSGHAADSTFTLTMENCAHAAWQARAALSTAIPAGNGLPPGMVLVERINDLITSTYEKDGDGYYDTPLTILLRDIRAMLSTASTSVKG